MAILRYLLLLSILIVSYPLLSESLVDYRQEFYSLLPLIILIVLMGLFPFLGDRCGKGLIIFQERLWLLE